MSEEELTRIIWPDDKKLKDQAFWSEISTHLISSMLRS